MQTVSLTPWLLQLSTSLSSYLQLFLLNQKDLYKSEIICSGYFVCLLVYLFVCWVQLGLSALLFSHANSINLYFLKVLR